MLVNVAQVLKRCEAENEGDLADECFESALRGISERGIEEISVAQGVRLRLISGEVAAAAEEEQGAFIRMQVKNEPLARWVEEEFGADEGVFDLMLLKSKLASESRETIKEQGNQLLYKKWQKEMQERRSLL